MARLILHLGFAKTGTTTLQHRLYTSRRALADRGVLYPSSFTDEMHVMLVPFLLGPATAPPYLKQRYGGVSGLEQAAQQAWAVIEAEISKTAPETIILSSEHLGELTRDPQFPKAMEQLSRYADQMTIVAYVRSPVSEYASYAQEQLKAGRKPLTPDQRPSVRDRLEPLMSLSQIELCVHPYEPQSLINKDITADFVTRYLPADAAEMIDKGSGNRNQSISAEAMAVLECYIYREFPRGFHTGGKYSYHLMRRLRETDRDLQGYSGPRYKSGVAQEIHRVTRDIDWLDEKFGIRWADPNPEASAEDPLVPPAHKMLRVRDYCIVDEERFRHLFDLLQKPEPKKSYSLRQIIRKLLRPLRIRRYFRRK